MDALRFGHSSFLAAVVLHWMIVGWVATGVLLFGLFKTYFFEPVPMTQMPVYILAAMVFVTGLVQVRRAVNRLEKPFVSPALR